MDDRFLDLDRHGVLRPPLLLGLCWAFLLRNSLLLLVAAASSLQGPNAMWAYGVISWPVLLFEAPMLLLMVAWLRRAPEAGVLPRWAWRHGRELMTFSAALDLARSAWHLATQDIWNPWPERFIVLGAVANVAVIAVCWSTPLFRAVFSEFPRAQERQSKVQ